MSFKEEHKLEGVGGNRFCIELLHTKVERRLFLHRERGAGVGERGERAREAHRQTYRQRDRVSEQARERERERERNPRTKTHVF